MNGSCCCCSRSTAGTIIYSKGVGAGCCRCCCRDRWIFLCAAERVRSAPRIGDRAGWCSSGAAQRQIAAGADRSVVAYRCDGRSLVHCGRGRVGTGCHTARTIGYGQ